MHPKLVTVIDSHTGGEPTRTVISGGPNLQSQDWKSRCQEFASKHDDFRHAVLAEPRGNDVLVGALLGKALDSDHAAGVVFFNNVGTLNMCGHGTMGIAVTLAHLGWIEAGCHHLETPVGCVSFELAKDLSTVTLENVPSYRFRKDVVLATQNETTARLSDGTEIRGDIAWGGNWFFLMQRPPELLCRSNLDDLLEDASLIRSTLNAGGIVGENGMEIDHIEFWCDSEEADSRGFVLCPGGQWDRSPCGTGTSAKLACLFADGKLTPGKSWRHESILGTYFEGNVRPLSHGRVVPTIRGRAWITGKTDLYFAHDDPFASGIPPT